MCKFQKKLRKSSKNGPFLTPFSVFFPSDSVTLGGKRESANRRSEINGRVVAGFGGRCLIEQQVISRYGRFLSDTCGEDEQGDSETVEKLRVIAAGLRGKNMELRARTEALDLV